MKTNKPNHMEESKQKGKEKAIDIQPILIVVLVVVGVIIIAVWISNTLSGTQSNYVNTTISDTASNITSPEKNKYPDSFINVQQEIAYNKLKFGMSKSEFNKLTKSEKYGYQEVGGRFYSFNYLFD